MVMTLNPDGTPVYEDYTDPSTALPPPSPPVPDAPSTQDLGLMARIPPSVMATPKPQSRFALTKAETASPIPGINPAAFAPNYARQVAAVDTGVPGSAAPMTKLGKLLYILKGVGTGAMVGSTQPTLGTGYEAAQQNNNQQQQFQMGMEQARQNLQYQPLMRALMAQQLRSKINLQGAQADRAESAASRWGKPTQVGDRMMAYNPDSGKMEDVGAAGKPVTKVMGDRTMQWDADNEQWKDVGAAPTKGTQTPYGKIPPEVFGLLGDMPSTSTWEGKDYGSVQAARQAWGREAQSMKENQAKQRAAGYATTRGQVVTDTETGITAPVSWAQLESARPGKYVAPQYDPNTRLTVKAYQDLAPGGKVGTQVTSYNTFLQHAGALYDAVETLKNSGYPDWNKSVNWLRQHSGDPRVAQFLTRLDPVQKEFQSFLLNNRALYSEDRETAQNMMGVNSSPAQMYGVLREMIHTGNARLSETNETFKRATGNDIPDLISPKAQAALEKVGGPEAAAEMPPIVPRRARVGGGGNAPPQKQAGHPVGFSPL